MKNVELFFKWCEVGSFYKKIHAWSNKKIEWGKMYRKNCNYCWIFGGIDGVMNDSEDGISKVEKSKCIVITKILVSIQKKQERNKYT
jgi:hypothetical protein